MEPITEAPSRKPWNSTPIPQRVKERAATRWDRDGDCWISQYSTASHGYAQVGWQNAGERSVVLAHRASWEHSMGPVPLGYTLDHQCKQKKCVNPGHLRILTNYENARRTCGRDWPLGECANGHSNEHLRVFSDGRRHCGICAASVWRSAPKGARKPRGPAKEKTRRPAREKAPQLPKPPRTACKYGHAWIEENLYRRKSGRHECLPCKKEAAIAWHSKQRNQ